MVRTEITEQRNYEDVVSKSVTVEIQCDAHECPVGFKWTLKSDGSDPELPDGVYRFLILGGFIGGKQCFCSKYCLLHWMKTYTPPKSPREDREAVEEAAKRVKEADEASKRLTELAESADV